MSDSIVSIIALALVAVVGFYFVHRKHDSGPYTPAPGPAPEPYVEPTPVPARPPESGDVSTPPAPLPEDIVK